jgi:hypothetical protein
VTELDIHQNVLPAPPSSLAGSFARRGIALGAPVRLEGAGVRGTVAEIAPGFFVLRNRDGAEYVVGREDLPRVRVGGGVE